MKIFVFEFICGGGLWGRSAASELTPLGGAMLRAVIEDMAGLGVDVVTTLDERVAMALPEGIETVMVGAGRGFDEAFAKALSACDAALVIAPEFHNLLQSLSQRVIDSGKRLLGCDPTGVAHCSDKLALARRLRRACIATPLTIAGLPGKDELPDLLPMVVKPRFGAGCEDTFVVESESELASLPARSDWISQPLVPGTAASAAFVVMGGGRVVPLRAGLQKVAGGESTGARGAARRLAYSGGVLPVMPYHVEARVLTLAQAALAGVPGLRGFVGVDVLIGHGGGSKDCIIEVNPRITVAYVGLRALSHVNLAAWLLAAAGLDGPWTRKGESPEWRDGIIDYTGDGRTDWAPHAEPVRPRTARGFA